MDKCRYEYPCARCALPTETRDKQRAAQRVCLRCAPLGPVPTAHLRPLFIVCSFTCQRCSAQAEEHWPALRGAARLPAPRWCQDSSKAPVSPKADPGPAFFQVGKRYRHRRGQYTVVAIDGDNLLVRYDDGVVGKLGAARQQRILENVALGPQRTAPVPVELSDVLGYSPRMYALRQRWDRNRSKRRKGNY
jgi:hypothetical protein